MQSKPFLHQWKPGTVLGLRGCQSCFRLAHAAAATKWCHRVQILLSRAISAGQIADCICRELFADPPRVHIVLGDQGNASFWKDVEQQFPDGFDVILDDGGALLNMIAPHLAADFQFF